MAPRNWRPAVRGAASATGSGVLLAAALSAWPAVDTLREMRDMRDTRILIVTLLVSQGAVAVSVIRSRRRRKREQARWRDSGGAVITGGGCCGCEDRLREVEWRLHLYAGALTDAFARAGVPDPAAGERKLRAVSGGQGLGPAEEDPQLARVPRVPGLAAGAAGREPEAPGNQADGPPVTAVLP